MYYVELVWNREFEFVRYGSSFQTIELAIVHANALQNSGNGASVKKTRIVDANGKVVWAYGKLVKQPPRN